MLLIAGGETDPNVASILARATERGMAPRALLVGPGTNPAVRWDFQHDRLLLEGAEVRPRAVYLRYDVFAHMADARPETSYRAQAWWNTIYGWMLAHPGLRMLNRRGDGHGNKPYMLHVARGVGLAIPFTQLTNEIDQLERAHGGEEMIAKPVGGGGYTQPFAELLAGTERREGRTAAPALVQRRMVAPEVRIYAVGAGTRRRFIPFRVASDALDYRVDDDAEVVHLGVEQVDRNAVEGLGRLMDALAMDYGAADFKTDPATGALTFLEINSGPMFSAFDAVSGFAVSDAILDWLTAA